MIKLTENFSTTVLLEDIIIPNNWDITVTLLPDPSKNKLFGIAIDRLQYYISEILNNSIFVSRHNIGTLSDLQLKAQVHIFPDEPWDQLVAMCLYVKFNSILEGVFIVDDISIASHQAKGVSHSYEEADGGVTYLLEEYDSDDDREYVSYWYKPISQFFLLSEGLKLVTQDWRELELDYSPKNSAPSSNYKKPGESDNTNEPPSES